MVAAASPAQPPSRTWPKKAYPPICPPLSTISKQSLAGSPPCAGLRLAKGLGAAKVPQMREQEMGEMGEMDSTGDLAVH